MHLCSFCSRRRAPSPSIRCIANSGDMRSIERAGISDLVEGFHHGVLVCCVDGTGAVALAEPEDGFYD